MMIITRLQQAAAAVIAALHHPMRAKLYGFIRRERRPVTREQAATAIGISPKLAAFHLGQLVDVGLLHANDLITPGRRGPGRAPKAYTWHQASGTSACLNAATRCSPKC
ncbi:MAG: helix-turn-helix domain-containing protein [Pseudonocardiaceae bacterium]